MGIHVEFYLTITDSNIRKVADAIDHNYRSLAKFHHPFCSHLDYLPAKFS